MFIEYLLLLLLTLSEHLLKGSVVPLQRIFILHYGLEKSTAIY